MKIYPSILETTRDGFKTQLEQVLPHFDHFQIDIADGVFVNNKTIQIEDIAKILERVARPEGVPQNAQFSEHFVGRESDRPRLSVFANKTFEFHLMVSDWQKEVEKLDKLQAQIDIPLVLVHLKALKRDFFNVGSGKWDIESLTSRLLEGGKQNNTHPTSNFKYGLVLNPEDDVAKNWEIIQKFPIIQIMTIHPGKQGQPFIPEMLNKIDHLRQRDYTDVILLDGGINDRTIPLIVSRKNRPDVVCPGSFFKVDVANRLKQLQQLVKIH